MRRQFNIGFQVALLAIIGLQTSPLRAEEVLTWFQPRCY